MSWRDSIKKDESETKQSSKGWRDSIVKEEPKEKEDSMLKQALKFSASPVGYISEKMNQAMEKDPTLVDTALSSYGDAALFGLTDKIAGGVAAGVDVVGRGLNKIAPDTFGKTTSQKNEQLAAEGATGDLGPQGPGDMYRQVRDSTQSQQNALSAQNPKTALVAALLGGATGGAAAFKAAPAAATALLAPIEVAANAPIVTQAAAGAVNAIPTSLALGLESNSADFTKGEMPNIKELGADLALGMGLGATVPTVLSGVPKLYQAGKDKLAKAISPEQFEMGQKGVNTAPAELLPAVQQESASIVDKLTATIQSDRSLLQDMDNKLVELTASLKTEGNQKARMSIDQQITSLKDKKGQLEKSIRQQETLRRQSESNANTDAQNAKRVELELIKKQGAQDEKALQASLGQATEESLAPQRAELERKLADHEIELESYNNQKKIIEKKQNELIKRRNADEVNSINESITNFQNQQTSNVGAQKQAFNQEGAQGQNALNQKKALTSEYIENIVEGKFQDMGQQYNAIDNAIDTQGVKFNLKSDVNKFVSSLPKEDQNLYKAMFDKVPMDGLDRQGFIRLRDKINDQIMNPATPLSIRGDLRGLLSKVRESQANQIKSVAGQEIYDRLMNLNKQYSGLSTTEKNFFSKASDVKGTKTLGVMENAQQKSPAAIIQDKAFRQTLNEVGDPQLAQEILEPVDSIVKQEQALAGREFMPQQDPKIAAQIQALEAKKTDLKYASQGTTLTETAQTELAKDENYKALVANIEKKQQTIDALKKTQLTPEKTEAIALAEKQLELMRMKRNTAIQEKANEISSLKKSQREARPLGIVQDEAIQANPERKQMLDEIAQLESAKSGLDKDGIPVAPTKELTELQQRVQAKKDSQTYPDKLAKSDTDTINTGVRQTVAFSRGDKLNENVKLKQLLTRHKEATGEDLSEAVQMLQQKIDLLPQGSKVDMSGEELTQLLKNPQSNILDRMLNKFTSKADLWSNKVGRDSSNASAMTGKLRSEPQVMAEKARNLGMMNLANRLEEIGNMPNDKKNKEIFDLMQQPSFRKLLGKDQK